MQDLVMTASGQEMLNNVISEHGTIQFTQAVSSSEPVESSDIQALESLTGTKQTVNITSIDKYSSTKTEIVVDFDGHNVNSGYYVKSVGIYATDGTNTVLFAVAIEDNTVYINGSDSIVPSKANYKFYISIGNSDVIETVTPQYASTDQVLSRIKNAGVYEAGETYSKNDLFRYDNGTYLVETPFTATAVPDFSKVYVLCRKEKYDHFAMEIDATQNANPSVENGGIKYHGGCERFSQQDWVDWLGYKPCVMYANGGIETYLDPNNYAKNVNGNDIDIITATSSNNRTRNVMIKYKRIGLTSCQLDYGKWIIRCTNDPCNYGYLYSAFSQGRRGGLNIFIGAYNSCVIDGKLHSLSDAVISSTGQSLSTYRTLAKANGAFYDVLDSKKLSFLKHLFMLQNGTIDGTLMSWFDTDNLRTGFFNATGMNKNDISTASGKFLGLETNGFTEVIDGCYVDSNFRLKVADSNLFNNEATGYIDCGRLYSLGDGYIGKDVIFDVTCGIIATNTYGTSETTFHSKTKAVLPESILNVNMTNLFNYELRNKATTVLNGATARLCFVDR